MFDLRAYEGLARTRYVLDASCVTAATLASMATVTGTGAVGLSTLNVPGGRINLTTSTNDTAEVKLPVRFGNSGGSVAAWAVEVEGLRTNGLRSEVALEISEANGSGTGLLWNNSGIAVSTTTGVTTPTLQAGNFRNMDDIRAGVLVEVPGGTSSAFATGYVGGTLARTATGVHASGFLSPRIRVAGSYDAAAASVVSFRRLTLTCIWGTAGGPITKVL